ncbi:hypothetical protein HBI23_236610 [Parastagonospora nodorum]|nr:hypothetical protein HBI06_246150 [Parastagonospora nodorum]KAH4224351.1 hypothetical protein HBI05_239200 [Parastagonospora nodorum]KAH5394519.1 hypothetical protein HBI47_239630 [Parastagonospora nodorum]KAH5623038.1 hypothetical protein HBI23_236610 [Parastagonospora nodorum]
MEEVFREEKDGEREAKECGREEKGESTLVAERFSSVFSPSSLFSSSCRFDSLLQSIDYSTIRTTPKKTLTRKGKQSKSCIGPSALALSEASARLEFLNTTISPYLRCDIPVST